jgi:hypothetical protein
MATLCAAALPGGVPQIFLTYTTTTPELWTSTASSSQPGAAWTAWETFPLPPNAGSGAAFDDLVSVSVAVGVPQLFALIVFPATGATEIWTCWKESAALGASWSEWITFTPLPEGVGTVTSLAATQMADGHAAVIVSTARGGVFGCYKASTVIGAPWSGWILVTPPAPNGSSPGCLAASTVAPVTPQLWGMSRDGEIVTCWEETSVGPKAWSGWDNFQPPPPGGWPPLKFAAAIMPGGAAQIWAAHQAIIETWWKVDGTPGAAWTQPTNFQPPPGGVVLAITVAVLANSTPQVIVLTRSGLWSCWKETTQPGAAWTTWTPVRQPPTIVSIYAISIDSFTANTIRSAHTDTDYLGATIQVGTNPPISYSSGSWEVSSGDTEPVGLISNQVGANDADSVVFNYMIINSGYSDSSQLQSELKSALAGLASKGAQALASSLTAAGGALEGAEIGTDVLPVVGTAIGALAGWIVGQLLGIAFADCDGTVAAEQVAATGFLLRSNTTWGTWRHTTVHPGTNSPAGCGANSVYTVNWSIASYGTLVFG